MRAGFWLYIWGKGSSGATRCIRLSRASTIMRYEYPREIGVVGPPRVGYVKRSTWRVWCISRTMSLIEIDVIPFGRGGPLFKTIATSLGEDSLIE